MTLAWKENFWHFWQLQLSARPGLARRVWLIQAVKCCSLRPAHKLHRKAWAWSELNYSDCFQGHCKHSSTPLEQLRWQTFIHHCPHEEQNCVSRIFHWTAKTEFALYRLVPVLIWSESNDKYYSHITSAHTQGSTKPTPIPPGRGCELLAALNPHKGDQRMSHSVPCCIRAHHNLLTIWQPD